MPRRIGPRVIRHFLWQRKIVNPYTIPLIVVPAAITIYASSVGRRWVRISLLLVATVVFWIVLQPHVHWTFSHPFNPNDGGPKAVALLFGWVYGLVFVITPVYLVTRIIHRIRQRRRDKVRARQEPGSSDDFRY